VVKAQKRKDRPFFTGLFQLEGENRQILSPMTIGADGKILTV
jgi:hypothetical protein